MNAVTTTQAALLATPKHLIEAAQMTITAISPAKARASAQYGADAKRLAAQLALCGYQLRRVTNLIEGGQTFMATRGKATVLLPKLGDVQRFLERIEGSGEALHYIDSDTSNPTRPAPAKRLKCLNQIAGTKRNTPKKESI